MRAVLASLLALALAACNPGAGDGRTDAETPTPRNPFFGTWELVHAAIAPWWSGAEGEEPSPDPAMAKFTLAADTTTGAPIVTCSRPTYTTDVTPPRGLFQGNLPDPVANAASLGFTAPDVTVLTYSCSENDADVTLDFAMLDDERIMLALDNVLYTFRRTGS